MTDFPTKQILPETFASNGYRATWHFVPAVDYSGMYELRERLEHRTQVHGFVRVESAGRFCVDRTSRPGYWFEEARDAMLYKLRFL